METALPVDKFVGFPMSRVGAVSPGVLVARPERHDFFPHESVAEAGAGGWFQHVFSPINGVKHNKKRTPKEGDHC